MAKVLLAATSGGHLTQIIALFEQVDDAEKIIFSEASPRLSKLKCRSYSYKRPKSQILTMLFSGLKAMYIICRERPQWVISTGAECGTAAIIAGKLLFRKTIHIETASRYRTRTMAAKICYPLVDHFYVQHKESLEIFGKKAKYIGGIL